MNEIESYQMINNIKCVRLYLKERISFKFSCNYYTCQRNEILNILKRTITSGESDSALVVGPRGCGKTHLMKVCLVDIRESIKEDDYLIVHLSGLVHTDDNLALRAIIEQLHVKELEGDKVTGSFSDNLLFVLQNLRGGDKSTARAIIFILDEFQLFCSHRNQTLLYNLFDVSKSSQTPVCVVGLTCRYDITELLEKRVSSRFSHRQILLIPSITIEDRIKQFSEYLTIEKITPALRKLKKTYVNQWNENIESLLKMPSVIQRLRRQLEISSNERAFKNVLFFLISKVTPENPFITFNNIEEAFNKYYIDKKVEYLKDLSVLELCMIISMCHQVDIYEGEPFNFEMIAKRYLKFAQHNSSVQITQRPILLKAFERIKELEFILPITSSSRNQKKEYLLYNLMVTKSQLKSAVYSYNGLPTDVTQWALSNAV